MVALPSDVARSHKAAKRVFQTVFLAMVSALERSLPAKKKPRHDNGQALAALCVGGMVVARAMVDAALADERMVGQTRQALLQHLAHALRVADEILLFDNLEVLQSDSGRHWVTRSREAVAK